MNYTLLSETFPKARKPYRCIWCGEAIPIGLRHRHERSIYDDFQDHRWHLECDEIAVKELFNVGDTEFIPYSNERGKREEQPPEDWNADENRYLTRMEWKAQQREKDLG